MATSMDLLALTIPRVALAGALLLGCQRQEVDVTREFPPPRLAVMAASSHGVVRYEATTDAAASVTLRHQRREASGALSVSKGWLSVDPSNLKTLDGALTFDLRTLELSGSDIEPALAARVLELEGKRRLLRQAQFRVERVLQVSSLAARGGRKADGDDGTVRYEVDVEVRGLLELHGFRKEQEAKLTVAFVFDQGATRGSPPRRVEVESPKALRVSLAPFRLATEGLEQETARLFGTAQLSVSASFLAQPH